MYVQLTIKMTYIIHFISVASWMFATLLFLITKCQLLNHNTKYLIKTWFIGISRVHWHKNWYGKCMSNLTYLKLTYTNHLILVLLQKCLPTCNHWLQGANYSITTQKKRTVKVFREVLMHKVLPICRCLHAFENCQSSMTANFSQLWTDFKGFQLWKSL